MDNLPFSVSQNDEINLIQLANVDPPDRSYGNTDSPD